jgi:hypothetical protein
MISVEMQVKKMLGYYHAGYGIMFCYQDTNNFYRVVITVDGFYLISKKVAGTYYNNTGGGSWTTTNPSWPASTNMVTGFGNANKIKVVNTGGGNFDLYFNGVYETSFSDATFTGGYNGYYVGIGSENHESFPTPMDVRVKLIAAF